MRIYIGLLLNAAAGFAHAATAVQPTVPASGSNAINALSSAELTAIRRVSQHILMAKSATPNPKPDNSLLTHLSGVLDQLIAQELFSPNFNLIQVQKSGVSLSAQQIQANVAAKQRLDALGWDTVTQLRQTANQLSAEGGAAAQQQIYSGGMPVGNQHSRMYRTFADDMEAALNSSNNRLALLSQLRNRVQPNTHGIADTAFTPRTPTMQAMPWEGDTSARAKNH
jgi:hypothetical protein